MDSDALLPLLVILIAVGGKIFEALGGKTEEPPAPPPPARRRVARPPVAVAGPEEAAGWRVGEGVIREGVPDTASRSGTVVGAPAGGAAGTGDPWSVFGGHGDGHAVEDEELEDEGWEGDEDPEEGEDAQLSEGGEAISLEPTNVEPLRIRIADEELRRQVEAALPAEAVAVDRTAEHRRFHDRYVAAPPPVRAARHPIGDALRDHTSVRRAVVLREVLGPPKSLQ